MRADTAAGALVRERIQSSAQTTAVISLAAVLVSVLSLFLILRENRRQRQIAEMNRRSAEQAELAEPRQVALPDHDEPRAAQPAERRARAAGAARAERPRRRGSSGWSTQAQQSGPVDAADAVGPARLRRDAGRPLPAARASRSGSRRWPTRCATRCAAEGAGRRRRSSVLPGTPERVHGDLDRLRQIFVHLARLRARGPRPAGVDAALRPRRRQPGRRDRLRRRRRGDGLEARPADGPERDRARPGHRRGAAAADRPRPDLGQQAAC